MKRKYTRKVRHKSIGFMFFKTDFDNELNHSSQSNVQEILILKPLSIFVHGEWTMEK